MAEETSKGVNGAPVETWSTELYNKLRRGQESYLDPKVSWRKEWVSNTRPTNLNDVGDIVTPDGDPPTPAAGRNWLHMGLESRQRGKVFENSEVADLSGRGGWDDDIYA